LHDRPGASASNPRKVSASTFASYQKSGRLLSERSVDVMVKEKLGSGRGLAEVALPSKRARPVGPHEFIGMVGTRYHWLVPNTRSALASSGGVPKKAFSIIAKP
jgi:hypothetical protein